jgi:hypothetical protein
MKAKFTILIILLSITGLILGLKKGLFHSKNDSFTNIIIPDVVDYNFHIKPILSDRCYTCHGPDANKRKAGLRLDTETAAYEELKENPGKHAIVSGKPNKSVLFERIMTDDSKTIMPPSDSQLKLNSYEKKLIKKWIEQGGNYDKHWAFISPQKSALPKIKNIDWVQNEIDYYILEKLEENDLNPSEKANKETLIRRLSLDITGLPPKTELTTKFSSTSTEDLNKIIDVFLASSSYGERMTQVWLDVARYADSHGYQDDNYRTMWPWRDWVIHAFNSNLPYDKFLTWQLAGDLLPNATKEQILATGFNRNHPITQEGGVIQEEYRSAYVVDRTNTLGKGILGLTLECAKCHDHKYDALSQKNYYEMYAFFNQVNEKGIQMTVPEASRKKYFADAPFITITDEEANGILSFINNKELKTVDAMVMNDSAPRKSFILNRGEYDSPTEPVEPNAPEFILPFSEKLPKNRLGLASWITDKNNPLTSRVYINRIWAMLFGKGLVKTEEDFGVQGSLPTHPKLLDWLAVDFMEHEWDIKYLLKKIMLSATYQQTSNTSTELKKIDPENILIARVPRFRMSGEMIRDYVLATSGLLNSEIGGPSVKPYQPAGLWKETNTGRGLLKTYKEDTGDKLYRRSLYTFWKRTSPPPTMALFDAPNRDNCEVRRQKTNTPLQALALQNDIQVLEASRVLAQKILKDQQNSHKIVQDLFEKILVRKPKEEELNVLTEYYKKELDRFSGDIQNAEKIISIGAYENLKTDPAKTAALMLTAQVLYNLDETITKE